MEDCTPGNRSAVKKRQRINDLKSLACLPQSSDLNLTAYMETGLGGVLGGLLWFGV